MAPAQVGKRGKVPLALFVEVLEVVDVQPMAGELRRQSRVLRIAQHSPRLGDEHIGSCSRPSAAACRNSASGCDAHRK